MNISTKKQTYDRNKYSYSAIGAEVLLSSFLVLLLSGENTDGKSDQNQLLTLQKKDSFKHKCYVGKRENF